LAKHTLEEAPIELELPPALLREIGRVMVRHAYLELQLSQFIYNLLKVDPKRGRVGANHPTKLKDRLTIILNLMSLEGIDLPKDEQAKLRTILEDCDSDRDCLAHGVWARSTKHGRLMLRLARGTWQVAGGRTSRAITPEGRAYTVDNARKVTSRLSGASAVLDALWADYDNGTLLASSRRKSQPQSQRKNRPQGRSDAKPRRQRRSSRE
jgi:hypothetical protein